MKINLATTEAYDTYWRFAAKRQAVYFRRLVNPVGPWSDDPTLNEYRFTNVYRIADRVSQYLIRNVQYNSAYSQTPKEVFFRTILFKLFNRIKTWETLERELGPISWKGTHLNKISEVLNRLINKGERIYSAAYIMPSPSFGHPRKHNNHLVLLNQMMQDDLPSRLASADSLKSTYEMILAYPGMGPFLAFQFCIDLNYSILTNFSESDFVVAGPGALDGITKCFHNPQSQDPSTIIHWMVERQDYEFSRLNLRFDSLFGRRLQPVDCQNIFCELSKYARIAHPDLPGKSGRKKIKQRYKVSAGKPVERPFFPPKWGIDASQMAEGPTALKRPRQMTLFEVL